MIVLGVLFKRAPMRILETIEIESKLMNLFNRNIDREWVPCPINKSS